jgi:serine/threonine-protein kinase
VHVGAVLGGKYRLTRRLGDGAMGTVFAAQHERLGREVAVKILRADLCSHVETAARFQREAELVTRIGHPSIVAVYDFGRADDGSLYYVMELIAGQTLRARLQQGPLSDDELVTVFAPLLSALAAAHGVGVVHRGL